MPFKGDYFSIHSEMPAEDSGLTRAPFPQLLTGPQLSLLHMSTLWPAACCSDSQLHLNDQ